MNAISPLERVARRERWLHFVIASALLLVLSLILDLLLAVREPDTSIEQFDWYRLVRVLGYLPTWIVVAIVLALVDLGRSRVRPWHLLVIVPAIAGLIVEILKPIVGRVRPRDSAGMEFNWLWNESQLPLSTASSHAAVAFGAALVLARLAPGSGWIALPLAGACAITRLVLGAHYLSDVVLAALIAWAITELFLPRRLWR